LTLTYDLKFKSEASYSHDPHTGTYTHILRFKAQSVQKIEWKVKETDKQTGATDS